MHSDPIAYFITWTCYGTWLPGDDRGWTRWHKGEVVPQPLLADWCKDQMVEAPVVLAKLQRELVVDAIEKHCEFRGWNLHGANCRTNHCHVVVTANSYSGKQVRDQLKAKCTRQLKEFESTKRNVSSRCALVTEAVREKWWTRNGSVRYIFDEESLEGAIQYTLEAQDLGGSKFGDQAEML